jgi:hypothetical protein
MIEEKLLARHRVSRMVVVLKPTPGPVNDQDGADFRQKAHRAHVIATANVGADVVRDCLLAPLHTLGEYIQVIFMVLVESDDPAVIKTAVRKMAARSPFLHIRGRVVVDWALHLSQVSLGNGVDVTIETLCCELCTWLYFIVVITCSKYQMLVV